MTAQTRKKPRSAKKTAKTYSFTLSLGGLVSVIAAGAAALTAFFALGVLVGRGYQPERAVPRLAQVMGQAAEANHSGDKPMQVLKPEELGYRERLTHDDQEQQEEPAKAEKAKQQSAEQTEAAPEGEKTKTEAPQPSGNAESSPDAEAASDPDDRAEPGGQAYDYVYQVAAFSDMQRALELQKAIREAGLKPSMQQAQVKDQTWYRVLVLFQGRPKETRGMKDKLSALGLNTVIMKSKKPLQ